MLAKLQSDQNSHMFLVGLQNGNITVENSPAASHTVKHTLTIDHLPISVCSGGHKKMPQYALGRWSPFSPDCFWRALQAYLCKNQR